MELIKYTIAVLVGGFLTLLSNYIIENRKAKNETNKYRLDKMITVGEEFYKFSTYSLFYFSSLIDTMSQRGVYASEGADYFLNVIAAKNEEQLQKIRDNNITITTAAFYFKVTDSEKATEQMLALKEANLKMHHAYSVDDYDLKQTADEEYIKIVKSIITQIKDDQETISSKIKSMLKS